MERKVCAVVDGLGKAAVTGAGCMAETGPEADFETAPAALVDNLLELLVGLLQSKIRQRWHLPQSATLTSTMIILLMTSRHIFLRLPVFDGDC